MISPSTTNASASNRSDVTEGVDKKGSVKERPDSVAGDKEDKKRNKVPPTDSCPMVVVEPADPEQGETRTLNESEKNLALRFKIYEASQKNVMHILSFWDRVQGILLFPLNYEEMQQQAEDQRQRLSSRRTRKDREKERQEKLEKERLEKERLEKVKALEDSEVSQLEGEGAEGLSRGQGIGVPCLDIQVLGSEDVIRMILESGKLPTAEQVRSCKAQILSLPWCGPWCIVS